MGTTFNGISLGSLSQKIGWQSKAVVISELTSVPIAVLIAVLIAV